MKTIRLFDQFDRVHDYLRISLTEKCNLRCSYCMPEEGVALTHKTQLMTREEINGLAGIFTGLGVKKIRVTGGEPLVRKDIGGILDDLSQLPVELTLTTNAVLVDRFIDTLKNAGIRSLNISLDTLKRDKFRTLAKRDDFNRVRSNIDLLLAAGFHVKINVVVIKAVNTDEILDFVAWSDSAPVHIRFIEFMPFDGNQWAWEKIYAYSEILEQISGRFAIEKLKDHRHATAKAYRVKGAAGTFAVISSMTHHFCNSCNRLRLTADGKLKNCLFSKEETDLLSPYRSGEDIKPLIIDTLRKKAYKHGGIDAPDQLADPLHSGRSMIRIGG